VRPTERIERAFEGIRTDRTIADLRAERDALREALRRLLSTINPGNVDSHAPDCRCVIHEALAALQRRSAT